MYSDSSPTLAVFNGNLWITWVNDLQGTGTDVDTFSTTNGTTFTSEGWCGVNDPSGDMPQTGAAVAMASNEGLMWYAYQTQGGAGNHSLRVCSTTAVTGSTPTYYSPGHQVGGGVDAVINGGGDVYFVYKDYNSHDLIVTGTSTGSSFVTGSYSGIQINGNQEINPSAAQFYNPNNMLYLAYTQNGADHYMYWTEN